MKHVRFHRFLQAIFCLFLLASCVHKHDDADFLYRNIDDFSGQQVAVCVSSTYDTYLSQHHPDIELFRVAEPTYGVLPVLEHQVPAVLLGGGLAKAVVRENPNLVMLSEPVFVEEMGIGFNNTKLRDDFNDYLEALRASDSLSLLIQKWSDDGGTAEMWGIEPSGDSGILRIGVTMTMPYAYLRGSDYCGIDLELLFSFAARHHLKPQVKILGLTSLVAALSSDKVDVICGGLAITPERADKFFFANSHITSSATLVVKREHADPNAITEVIAPEALTAFERGGWWDAVKQSFYHNLIVEKRYMLIVRGMDTTLYISLMSILIGTFLSLFVCFARMNKNRILRYSARVYIALLRGIPQVVLLMIMFYIVFAATNLSSKFVATITFSLYFAASVAEVFRVAIQSIDKGQAEAGRVLGFSRLKTFIYIIFPQALRRILPVYKNEIISLVKITAIVGYVAVQDLTQAGDIIRSRTFEAFFPLILVAVLYFLLAWSLIFILKLIEKRYAAHHRH